MGLGSDYDGVSVLPTLLGGKQNLKDRFMYWEFFESGHIQIAVRRGKWKAVRLGPDKPASNETSRMLRD